MKTISDLKPHQRNKINAAKLKAMKALKKASVAAELWGDVQFNHGIKLSGSQSVYDLVILLDTLHNRFSEMD